MEFSDSDHICCLHSSNASEFNLIFKSNWIYKYVQRSWYSLICRWQAIDFESSFLLLEDNSIFFDKWIERKTDKCKRHNWNFITIKTLLFGISFKLKWVKAMCVLCSLIIWWFWILYKRNFKIGTTKPFQHLKAKKATKQRRKKKRKMFNSNESNEMKNEMYGWQLLLFTYFVYNWK